MSILRIPILYIAIAISLGHCEKFRYDNYALYHVKPDNAAELQLLQTLFAERELDFWSDPVAVNDVVSVMTTPSYRKRFEELLKANTIEANVVFEDVQSVIDNQTTRTRYVTGEGMKWEDYYVLEDIYKWLDDLAIAHPTIVTSMLGGSSYEGRDIKGIKISHGTGRKSIFIEGGIHAREWISPATVNYITNELLYSQDPETIAAAEQFDWYIFPVTNPDGYEFTQEFRLWRKNRKPYGNEFGVDLNRNWNSNWLGLGASSNPASNTYAGPGPFSEIESLTLGTLIEELAPEMDMYLSFHSSGQLLLIPYGNTTEPLDNYYDAIKIGRRAMGSLAVRYGTQYTTGNIAEAIYVATGTSIDWVKERLRVPLVYCYELRDRGQYGHLLPPEQILPTGEEVMDSVLALIREGRAIGYMNSAGSLRLSAFVTFAALLLYLPVNL